MPNTITTLDSHASDILEGRRKTKEFRFKPLPAGVERVEDVIRQAVDYLGEHLAPLGFKAAPSKLTLSRKSGETTQVVTLQADGSNLSGASVQISAHALVRSPNYKRWRGQHGTKYASEYLWIKQLGYLSGSHEYLKWQLVDPASREKELSDLLSRIHSLALPVFTEWSDKESICRAVVRRTETDRLDWLMEIALWRGNPNVAKVLVEQHIQLRPQDMHEFMGELARFQANVAIDEPRHTPISGAAFLAARYDLEIAV